MHAFVEIPTGEELDGLVGGQRLEPLLRRAAPEEWRAFGEYLLLHERHLRTAQHDHQL